MDPTDRRYTVEHEWVKLDGDLAVVGITAFAQDQLGDVVYVELPKVGDRVESMKPFGVIESVKTASDLFAPISGTDRRGESARHRRAPAGQRRAVRGRLADPREAGQSERHRPIVDGRAVRRAGYQLLMQS